MHKLVSGEIEADTIRETLHTLVQNTTNPDTQLPTAYRGLLTLSALLPYLLVSRTDIQPAEIAQFAGTLFAGAKQNVASTRSRLSAIITEASAVSGINMDSAALVREPLLRTAHRADAGTMIATYYTAPAARDLVDNLSSLRSVERYKRDVKQELDFMLDLSAQLDGILQPQIEANSTEKTSLMSLDDLPVHMQVEWEALPPGSSLGDAARAIVEEKRARTNKPFGIDFERLKTLENLRQLFGEENTSYVRGSLRQRGIVRDGDKECPDEYILLLIDGPDGQVSSVVADSPIVGPHAMYVYRYDTAKKHSDWETVFRLEKVDARRLGARAVKHSTPKDVDLVETMTNKATELLTCRAEDFHLIEFQGNKAARIKQIVAAMLSGEFER